MHGQVKHRKDFVPVSQRALLKCDVCNKELKPGRQARSTLERHMKVHKRKNIDSYEKDQ